MTTQSRIAGWRDGAIGMLIFSASLPATRIAVLAFDPLFLTFARASLAGALAGALLALRRHPAPAPASLPGLVVVALGVVVGFPLLTALALRHTTSAHATVFLGLLPLSTAFFAVVRGGERPSPAFWGFAVVGAVLVAGFAWLKAGGGLAPGDLLMLAAIGVCGLGYAEGGRLSRDMGGLNVIAWALVMALPVMAALALWLRPSSLAAVGWPALAGLGYVSVFSMFVGFVFWYRGLAIGGIAAVGQLQLVQPFFALLLAALLLGETVGLDSVLVLIAVVACVAGARRFSERSNAASTPNRKAP
jgi:drug/metabolite transporter (DMT)-like permease